MEIIITHFPETGTFHVLFSGDDWYWRTYVPSSLVVSENGTYRLTNSAMGVLNPIAELNIEMSRSVNQ